MTVIITTFISVAASRLSSNNWP